MKLIDPEELRRLYIEQKLTDSQIAEGLRIDHRTVGRLRRRYGIPTLPRKARCRLTPQILHKLYVDERLTDEEIGRRYGYCAAWIGELRTRWGIQTIRGTVQTRRLTEGLLRQEYLVNKLTAAQIAEKYHIDETTVLKYLHAYGIPKMCPSERSQQGSVMRKRKALEILVGTVLGDGHLNRIRENSVRLEMKHAASQVEWLLCKMSLLSSVLSFKLSRLAPKTGFAGQPQYRAVSLCHPDLARIYSWFYDPQTGKRIITHECLRHLTPRAIATWILDDGSRQKCGRYSLYTQCFSEEENLQLADVLSSFGLHPKVVSYKSGKFYLVFPRKDGDVLADWITKYFGGLATMRYKAGLLSQLALPL